MSNFVQVEPDFVSTRIPNSYLPVFYRTIAVIAEKGDNMVEEHTVQCKDKKSDVIDCYNLYNALLATKTLNKVKLSNVLYNYLVAQLDNKYPDVKTPEYDEPETELVSMMVPSDYVFIYYALLMVLSKYGEDMLVDCKSSCQSKSISIIETFNLFRIAVREKDRHNEQLAAEIIKIVKEKLKVIYPNYTYPFSFYADTDCQLKVFVREVDGNPYFEINENDYELYVELFGSNRFPLVFPFVFSN